MFSDDSDLMVFPARDAAFTVRTRLKDGSVSVASRPFEARPDGALRARIPASEIDPGAEWVEIVVNYGRRPFAHLGESVPPRSYRVFPSDGVE